jgi:orotate phosphoribosyltransferase-like protein
MYSNDIKDQFLELRAKGLSLARIATDIHVSQRTLVHWNRQLALDIRALRAVHLEAVWFGVHLT